MNEDFEKIHEVLAGHREAYSDLVKKHQRNIYFYALRILKNPENADEITQKTFLKAYQALASFQFQSSFKTWLTAIALNLCRTELAKPRRDMVEITPQMELQVDEADNQEDLDDQRFRLRQALENLPLRQKEVVTLRIYQEMAFKEIAQALESTESAVKVNFHHAMKSLKEWIQT